MNGNSQTNHYELKLDAVTGGEGREGGKAGKFIYNRDGALTSDEATHQHFEYDALGRIVAVSNDLTKRRIEFGYNGLDQRVAMVEKLDGRITSSKNFVCDGNSRILEERDATTHQTLKRYFNLGEQRADKSSYYYTRDHLGSVRDLVDATGQIAAHYDYNVWGNRSIVSSDVRSSNNSKTDKTNEEIDCTLGYTDYYSLPGFNNLWLSPTRLYNPTLGRFTSPDPIGEEGGINLYRYCNNDPINSKDPMGLDAIMLDDSMGAGIGSIITPDKSAAGHSATLIGSNAIGWIYFSKDGYFQGNIIVSFKEFSDFYNDPISQRYDKADYFITSPEQNQQMINAGKADDLSYSARGHNCADLTANILNAGGISISRPAQYGITLPNDQYIQTVQTGIGTPFTMHLKHLTN